MLQAADFLAGSTSGGIPGTRRVLAVGGSSTSSPTIPSDALGRGDSSPSTRYASQTCHDLPCRHSGLLAQISILCSVLESWLEAVVTGMFLTVTQVRSHPSQIHMPIPIGDLYLIAVEVVSDKPLHQNGRFSSHSDSLKKQASQPVYWSHVLSTKIMHEPIGDAMRCVCE